MGTFARIVIKANRKKVLRLDVGVSALCQRASDGNLRGPVVLAMRSRKRVKVRRNGRFSASGTDRKSNVSWKIKGRFVKPNKARGTFKASQFNTVFNPYVAFDSELCSGKDKWTARLKR